MDLSIITINRNNAHGLEKTMRSVATQTSKEFEFIVVDGASTDESVAVVKSLESEFAHLKWVSEPDTGIYNAMNKAKSYAKSNAIKTLFQPFNKKRAKICTYGRIRTQKIAQVDDLLDFTAFFLSPKSQISFKK